MSATKTVHQQLARSTITTLTSLTETPTDFHVECSCGYSSRRFKRISTARRYMRTHHETHKAERGAA